jgi:hypothetical protein
VAKESYDRAPNDVNCAVTYAFSLYGLGRTAEGLEIIRKLPADQLHDPHASVYVAVLLLDENQIEAAQDYVQTAERGPVFPEERKLLDEALSKTPLASPGPTAANAAASPGAQTVKPKITPTATPKPTSTPGAPSSSPAAQPTASP